MDKIVIRKEIASLINKIKEQSDSIGNTEFIGQPEVNSMLKLIEELHKKANVFEYLNAIPEIVKEDSFIADEAPSETNEEEMKLIPDQKMVGGDPEIEEISIEPVIQISKGPEIKLLIGINDKFQFINELFGGKSDKYETAIQQFNSFKTKEEAIDYFHILRQMHNWKENNETVKRLLNLVNGRFS